MSRMILSFTTRQQETILEALEHFERRLRTDGRPQEAADVQRLRLDTRVEFRNRAPAGVLL